MEQVLAELAESQAQAVLLEARLALITDEVPSNSTKADDNFAKIQGKEGTINKFKVWRDRQRGTRDKIEVDYTSCRYGQMQTDIIEIGPHEDETQLQAIIRELNDLSQKHPQRDVRSEEVFTEIYLLLLEIKQLAIDNGVSPHLPNISGGNNNGKGGFINTELDASGTIITTDEIQYIICEWMPAYCEANGKKCKIGVNCKYYDATHLALMREGIPHVDKGCRLGVTTGYECFQFRIIDGKIYMRLASWWSLSRMRMKVKFNLSTMINPNFPLVVKWLLENCG